MADPAAILKARQNRVLQLPMLAKLLCVYMPTEVIFHRSYIEQTMYADQPLQTSCPSWVINQEQCIFLSMSKCHLPCPYHVTPKMR